MPRKRASGPVLCQVATCGLDLSLFAAYNVRCRICRFHQKAELVLHDGGYVRWCHACAKLEPIECFEGLKTTCTIKLEAKRASYRISKAQRAALQPPCPGDLPSDLASVFDDTADTADTMARGVQLATGRAPAAPAVDGALEPIPLATVVQLQWGTSALHLLHLLQLQSGLQREAKKIAGHRPPPA